MTTSTACDVYCTRACCVPTVAPSGPRHARVWSAPEHPSTARTYATPCNADGWRTTDYGRAYAYCTACGAPAPVEFAGWSTPGVAL